MLFLAGLRSQLLPGVFRPPADEALEGSREEEASDSGVGRLELPVAPAPPPLPRAKDEALKK